MCIFAVASTICSFCSRAGMSLWIASKCVSLQWQAQCILNTNTCRDSCELLQNVYLCSGKHNRPEWKSLLCTVVNCFKMCIFAVASTIYIVESCDSAKLWIASKCVSLQWQAQYGNGRNLLNGSCELLQNVYLCSGKHNRRLQPVAGGKGCELLQNVYLCSGKHNRCGRWRGSSTVVNCFKMCIFAVASTIVRVNAGKADELWIASKCVSLQWQAQ